ncbi:MAG: hypothetical protein VX278_22660 [Myxococcota bacterium]|nr:hypothetical protein [Myxococcota bacterium]
MRELRILIHVMGMLFIGVAFFFTAPLVSLYAYEWFHHSAILKEKRKHLSKLPKPKGIDLICAESDFGNLVGSSYGEYLALEYYRTNHDRAYIEQHYASYLPDGDMEVIWDTPEERSEMVNKWRFIYSVLDRCDKKEDEKYRHYFVVYNGCLSCFDIDWFF